MFLVDNRLWKFLTDPRNMPAILLLACLLVASELYMRYRTRWRRRVSMVGATLSGMVVDGLVRLLIFLVVAPALAVVACILVYMLITYGSPGIGK